MKQKAATFVLLFAIVLLIVGSVLYNTPSRDRYLKQHPNNTHLHKNNSKKNRNNTTSNYKNQFVTTNKNATKEKELNVIQTWKTREIPKRYRDNVERIKSNKKEAGVRIIHKLFSHYDIMEFVRQYYPPYFPKFVRFPHMIQRIDFFRYLAVYHYGGLYLDLDVLLLRSLEELANEQRCVFPVELQHSSDLFLHAQGFFQLLGNYAFYAPQHHPFLLAVINNILHDRIVALVDGDAFNDSSTNNDNNYSSEDNSKQQYYHDNPFNNNLENNQHLEKDSEIKKKYNKYTSYEKKYNNSIKYIKKAITKSTQKQVFYTTGPVLVTQTYIDFPEKSSVHLLKPVPFRESFFGDFGKHVASGVWKE